LARFSYCSNWENEFIFRRQQFYGGLMRISGDNDTKKPERTWYDFGKILVSDPAQAADIVVKAAAANIKLESENFARQKSYDGITPCGGGIPCSRRANSQ
jgi:hypothetical protein